MLTIARRHRPRRPFPTRPSLAIAAALFAVACGSPQSPADPDPVVAEAESQPSSASTAQPSSDPDRERKLQALRDRQEAACDQVGDALLQCAIEDARANMSPDEIAKLDLEQTGRAFKAKFSEECLGSDMSPRQVGVFEQCLADTACSVFVACLDQARPQSQ